MKSSGKRKTLRLTDGAPDEAAVFNALDFHKLTNKRRPKAKPNEVVSGVGPDAPLSVNKLGGRQSDSPFRFDLLPPLALLEVARVLKRGAERYGEHNWHALSAKELVDHAGTHILCWLAGDESDGHLEHAACRMLMALEIERRGGPRANPEVCG